MQGGSMKFEVGMSRLMREYKVVEVEADNAKDARAKALRDDDGEYCDGKVGKRTVEYVRSEL